MRLVLGAAMAILCVGLLSSCSVLPLGPLTVDPQQQANDDMKRIAGAVNSDDSGALKKLFSPRARANATDLDGGLTYFLSVFPSGGLTWKSTGPPAMGGYSDNQTSNVESFNTYIAFANGKKYDLYFAEFTPGSAAAPDIVGLYALGVTPYNAHPATTPTAASTAFYNWAAQFDVGDSSLSGTPGVYVPQN